MTQPTVMWEVEFRSIFVQTMFESVHAWEDAPEEHKLLRNPHRHMFHVNVVMNVSHNNRDIEFIDVKRKLDPFLWSNYTEPVIREKDPIVFGESCETMAQVIGMWVFENYPKVNTVSVTVSEDGENGAALRMRRTAPTTIPEVCFEYGKASLVHKDFDFPFPVKDFDYPVPAEPADSANSAPSVKKLHPFFGIEAEGPLQGMPTIFIPCTAHKTDIWKACALFRGLLESLVERPEDLRNKFQVYLGAGDLPVAPERLPIAIDHLFTALNHFGNMSPIITLECADLRLCPTVMDRITLWRKNFPAQYKKGFLSVVTSTAADVGALTGKVSAPDYLKEVDDETVTWTDTTDSLIAWETRLTDPRFKLDMYWDEVFHRLGKAQELLQRFVAFIRTPFDVKAAIDPER